jgi:SGNH domain (fused to AT3 domains)
MRVARCSMGSIQRSSSAPLIPPVGGFTGSSANRHAEPTQIAHKFPRRGLISGAVRPGGSAALLLSLPVLRSLGKYSYSWYLWHWPILTLAEARLSSLPLYGRVLCAAAALGLAVLSTRLIENPIRFHPRLVQRNAWSLGLAALLTLGGIGLSGSWRQLVQRTEQFRVFVQPIRDVPRFYQFGCVTPFLDARLRECVFGDVNSSTTVVLLGDSHAAQWFPALESISNQNRWRLVTMIKMACPAVFLRVVQSKLGREEQQCALWREAAIKRIVEIGAHAVVVATSTEYLHVRPQEWFQGTRMLAQRLTSSGVRMLFMRDTPHAPFTVPQCMARAAWRGSGDCNLMRSQALEETVFGIEKAVAQSLPYVFNIDLSDRICSPEKCEVLQGGRIIFRDRDHLTASYIESLAPALAARIVPLISMKAPALGKGNQARPKQE